MINITEIKITLIVILTNLIIGNTILYICGIGDLNYPLMIGMSMACIMFYFLFFRYSNFRRYSHLKLILISIFSCMMILLLGNLFAIFIYDPEDAIDNILAAIFMGIVGNFIFFPVVFFLGLLNYVILIINLKSKAI